MNYYLVIVQNDSTQAVYSYNNLDDAKANYHNELAYRGEGRESTLCVILDEKGNIVTERDMMNPMDCRSYNERWDRTPKPDVSE